VDDAIAGCTHIPNFPAETHVDRSIVNAGDFAQTDVKGTRVLREAARNAAVHRYLQVSTDEVYSDVEAPHRSTEANPLPSPRTVLSLQSRPRPHGPGPACDLRPSPDHYPKLIWLFVTNALEGLPLPFYRDGQQLRDWLYVEDH